MLAGSGEPSADKPDDGKKSGQDHGRIDFAPSPQSSESSFSALAKRGRPSVMDRQTSSERRLSLGLDPTSRNNNFRDGEISLHQYRAMPVRRGRPSLAEQPSFSVRSRKRVTIFPYHPWTPARARTPGKVDWVPPTVDEVLNLAYKHFGKVGTRLLNQDCGDISSTEFIMDSEKVYVVDDDDVLTGGSQ